MTHNKKLLTRISAIAAGLALPSIAGAQSVTINSSPTGESANPTVWIRLDANITGKLVFVITPRAGANLTGTFTGSNQQNTTIDFGTASSNPTAFAVGQGADVADGAVYIAQLHAELYYTGFNNASVDIDELGTRSVPTPAVNLSTNPAGNYEYRWFCGTGTTAGARDDLNSSLNDPDTTLWTAAGAYNPAGNPLGASANCFTGSTVDAGSSIGTDVDLALFFSDSAPTGSYSATYRFTVTATS